ncbi:hypothetical protein HK104_005029 [Borealophlyctis nickersoniae]|nr:hypothetical protein HK104_005029 [Borealophlyctis nickersoniae]
MAANAANAAKASASIINVNSANLLRLGALGFGLFYGFTRKHSLTRFVEQRERSREEEEARLLLEEGKVAFKAQCDREEAVLAARDGGRGREKRAGMAIGGENAATGRWNWNTGDCFQDQRRVERHWMKDLPSTDIDHYKFNAEQYLNWLVAQSEKAPPASAK